MTDSIEAPVEVWMIIASYYPYIGGSEQQAQHLAKRLRNRGWRVGVLTRRHNHKYPYLPPAQEVIDGVPVFRVYSAGPYKIASMMFVLAGLWYLVRNGRGRIFHAHDIGAPALLGIVAKLLLGGHCIVKIRSSPGRVMSRLGSLAGRVQAAVLQRYVDSFIVVSQEGRGFLRRFGVPGARVSHIPNGVDTGYFRPVSVSQKEACRQRLSLDTSRSIVLFLGRLVSEKGVDILLRAWKQLSVEQRANSLLLIVGDGTEEYTFRRLAKELQLEKSVRFEGRQENVLDYLHAVDLFVLPSRSEGLSNALLEAMACGLPVICSGVGGALDIIKSDKEGMLFCSEDIADLARVLAETLKNQECWHEMGAKARDVVECNASLDSSTKQLAELYQNLLSEKMN